MDNALDQLIAEARRWAESAHGAGWLSANDIAAIDAVDQRNPALLFGGQHNRPLVVAFFGGTGVGKSTLLNRLAAKQIARTGVERPTSREISIYLHESVRISELPSQFPLERVRIVNHRLDAQRDVLWADMPDIDSTDQDNRTLALEWLPYVDVLIYVVSPERYRDSREWRILRAQGAKHAWLFVLNHWDKGQDSQVRDFKSQLLKAGFQAPLIFRTDSRENASSRRGDDFNALKDTIRALADRNTIDQLQIRGLQMRLDELRRALGRCMKKFGDKPAIEAWQAHWHYVWKETTRHLENGLEWPIREMVTWIATKRLNTLRKSLKVPPETVAAGTPDSPPPEHNASEIWDDWAQMRLDDALDQWVVELDTLAIPIAPFQSALQDVRRQARRLILLQAEQGLRDAMANPATAPYRRLLKVAVLLRVALPLSAIGWVTFEVLTGYYASATTHQAYLGVNFAVHSLLLVVAAWLLPHFIYRKLKPSAEAAAIRGLQRGIQAGLDEIAERIEQVAKRVLRQRQVLLAAAEEIVARCRYPTHEPGEAANPLLARMLLKPHAGSAADISASGN